MNDILKLKRLEKGLSAAKLAAEAGSREMRVFAFERGRYPPHRDEAIRIAVVLGTDPAELWPELFTGGAADDNG